MIAMHRACHAEPARRGPCRHPRGTRGAGKMTDYALTEPAALEADPALPRASRHRTTRSRAAAGHSGKSKVKPLSSKRPGTTRLLLNVSSVSVRRKNAPISAIQVV